jgi:hypothetical protein
VSCCNPDFRQCGKCLHPEWKREPVDDCCCEPRTKRSPAVRRTSRRTSTECCWVSFEFSWDDGDADQALADLEYALAPYLDEELKREDW